MNRREKKFESTWTISFASSSLLGSEQPMTLRASFSISAVGIDSDTRDRKEKISHSSRQMMVPQCRFSMFWKVESNSCSKNGGIVVLAAGKATGQDDTMTQTSKSGKGPHLPVGSRIILA